MRALIVTGFMVLFALPATAATPDPAGVFRYQLRALGSTAGEAVLTIGAPEALGRQTVRRVRLEGRTTGLAARINPMMGDGTAIVDAAYHSRRIDWKAEIKGTPRDASAKIGPRGVRGSYRRGDRRPVSVVLSTDQWPLDSISAYAWLPQQELTPGRRFERPFFDGRKLGTLVATVGKPKTIHIPMGLREAIPVHLTLTRKGKTRKLTLWIGPDDRVLYRMQIKFGVLNGVKADLVGMRRSSQARVKKRASSFLTAPSEKRTSTFAWAPCPSMRKTRPSPKVEWKTRLEGPSSPASWLKSS